jgi:hypothetical protein
MDPEKNARLFAAACASIGVDWDENPSMNKAKLMNLPIFQFKNQRVPINEQPAKEQKHLDHSTFVAFQLKHIMNTSNLGSEKATAEANRRWQRVKMNTLRDDDFPVDNKLVAAMMDEIKHNGWILILIDEEHHYFRFPVPIKTASALATTDFKTSDEISDHPATSIEEKTAQDVSADMATNAMSHPDLSLDRAALPPLKRNIATAAATDEHDKDESLVGAIRVREDGSNMKLLTDTDVEESEEQTERKRLLDQTTDNEDDSL